MDCHIQSMASSSPPDDVNIPEGKVEAVCREWLIREDGVLAYKLQSEEIQHHYGHNKERNQLVRKDLQEAKSIQKSEEEEVIAMQLAYEKLLKEQEDQDAFLAKQLQEKILQEDIERQKRVEEEDQRIALELQRKEKLRLQRKREEKELRQAEKARLEISSASNSSSIKSKDDVIFTRDTTNSPLDKNVSLLSLEPPDNLTPDQFQLLVDSRDAELARLLQEQEIKSQSSSKPDQQEAIEAQDRELAKILQDQERARARKAREKTRLRGQQSQEAKPAINTSEVSEFDTPVKERFQTPEWNSQDSSFPSNYSKSLVNGIPVHASNSFDSASTSSSLPSPSSSSLPPYEPSPCTLYQSEEFGPAPPYMPIQGTRRRSSLEKKKSKKDVCKTQ